LILILASDARQTLQKPDLKEFLATSESVCPYGSSGGSDFTLAVTPRSSSAGDFLSSLIGSVFEEDGEKVPALGGSGLGSE
jgi:hypothetical protein